MEKEYLPNINLNSYKQDTNHVLSVPYQIEQAILIKTGTEMYVTLSVS
jgi:hypothetical protein